MTSKPTFPLRAFLGICTLAFLLLMEYEIARSSVESLYLSEYGSEELTTAWLVVAGAMAASVAGYNALAGRWPLPRIFGVGTLATGGMLGLLFAARQAGVPGATLGLYVWKDVHVVILLEMLWTVANHRFAVHSAQKVYGLICFVGSLGSFAGGNAVGWLAEHYDTETALLATLPLFVVLVLFSPLLVAPQKESKQRPDFRESFSVFWQSGYLRWLLALIFLVQVVITVVDFQYNATIEAAYTDPDQRTAVMGQVYAWISGVAMVLQLITGIILGVIGVGHTMVAVPAILGSTLVAFALVPQFALMAAAKVASKALDYSVFRAAKEILYIPLNAAEKTQGKAIVDMFGYRVAKGGASLLLMGTLYLLGSSAIGELSLVLVGGWILVTLRLVKGYRERTGSISSQP